jgi:tetratricopeptide (TPR) repeat protein
MDRFDWIELDKVAAPADTTIREEPKDGPSFYRAARRMREAGHFGAAAALYQRAAGFDEHFYAAWVEWIDTLVRANHLEEADRRSREALDAYRQVRVFYAARALVLARFGQLAEAYSHVDISLEQAPMWYSRLVRAEVLLRDSLEHRGAALECLVAGTRGADAPWEPHFIGGLVLLDAGWPAQAAAFFGEAVHVKPTAVAGLLCLGDCFKSLRLYDQALFYYHKAIEVEPANELALARQRDCAPRLYGLTKAFRQEDLRKKWDAEYGRWTVKRELNIDDF